MKSDNVRGALAALASAVLAAGFLIPFKAAASRAAVVPVVIAMLVCAGVFNTVTALVQQRVQRTRVFRTPNVLAAVVLAVCTVVGNIGIISALSVQQPAITSVLLQTQILIVAATAWLFLGEAITARFAVGAAIAVAGFVVMNLGTELRASTMGVMCALLAAFSFATMQVYTRSVIHRIDAVAVNAMRLWLSVVALMVVPGEAQNLIALDGTVWVLAATGAFLGPYLSRLCLMYTVKFIPASRGTLITMINPVFAFALGFLFFGAIPGTLDTVGGAMILVGIAIPVAYDTRK